MNMINKLMILQEKYERVKECSKVYKDETYIVQLKKLKTDFEKAKEEYMVMEKQLNEIRQKLTDLSSKISCEKEEIDRNELELKVRGNSDYKLIGHINEKNETIKKKIEIYEDESLILMEEEERTELEKEELRASLIKLKEDFTSLKKIADESMKKARREEAELMTEITDLRKVIPEELIKIFDSLVEKKGHPVARFEGGVCSSCRMRVSALTADRVFKMQETAYCDTCGRILYFENNDFSSAK